MTMTLVSTTTLSVAATNITFSSIPQTGTDLYIVFSSRRSGSGGALTSELFINNDTAMDARRLSGNGGTTGSGSDSQYVTISQGTSTTSSTFANYMIYIPNYTGSNYKSFTIDAVTENNAAQASQYLISGVWYGTSAITSIKFDAGDTFVAGTTASLYIITKGSGGATV